MAEPKPLNSADLSERIKKLAAAKVDQLNQLLAAGNWQAAVHLIDDIHSDAMSVQGSCRVLALAVNNKHWSPLSPPEADGDD